MLDAVQPGLSANIQPEKIRFSCFLFVDLVDLGEGVGLRLSVGGRE